MSRQGNRPGNQSSSRSGIRWLYAELPELVRRGVLAEDDARRLREHYGEPDPGAASRLTVLAILGVFGAALVGAGVILVFAHNWDALSRTARVVVSLGLLVVCQGLAVWALAARRASRAWAEGSSVLLSFGIGASIALISQTYHIPGDLDHFLFACLWLVVPLVHLMDSRATAIVFWSGMVVWAMSIQSWSGGEAHHEPYWIWILAAGGASYLVPLCLRHAEERATTLVMGFVAVVLPILMLCGLERSEGSLLAVAYAGVLAGLHGLGVLGGRDPAPWRRPFLVVGFIGVVIFGMVYSFKDPWTDPLSSLELSKWGPSWDASFLAYMIGGALGGGIGVIAAVRAARGRRWHEALPSSLFVTALVGWIIAQGPGLETVAAALFNAYLLALGFATLAHGMRSGEFTAANAGLLVVAGVFVLRFFDSELSFLARGVGFIALGLGIITINVWIARSRWRTES